MALWLFLCLGQLETAVEVGSGQQWDRQGGKWLQGREERYEGQAAGRQTQGSGRWLGTTGG